MTHILTGEIDKNTTVSSLASRVNQLEDELAASRREFRDLESDADKMATQIEQYKRAIRALQDQLSPLRRAILAIFGEIDLVAEPEPQSSDTTTNHVSAPRTGVWQQWIQKFGVATVKGRIIQVLLDHGAMTQIQVRVAAQAGQSTVSVELPNLMRLGLVQKQGSLYSLKEMPRG